MRISRKDPVLIVGNDLSAVTLAFALQKQGFTEIIRCETPQSPSLTPFPMPISGATQAHFEAWELHESLATEMEAWQHFQRFDEEGNPIGKDGLARFQSKVPQAPWAGSSGAFRNWLLTVPQEGPAVEVVNKEFISFTQSGKGVEAHFVDGSSRAGVLLIGADGPTSRVRLQLMGEMPAASSSFICYRTLLDAHAVPAANPPYQSWIGAGAMVSLAPVNKQQLGLEISLNKNMVETSSAEVTKAALMKAGERFPEIVQAAIKNSWGEAWTGLGFESFQQPGVWGRGRVALVGPAAHPMGYAAGFEANADLIGALHLAEGLATHHRNLDKAFIHFEKKHKSRVKSLYDLNAYLQKELERTSWMGRLTREKIAPGLPKFMQGMRHWYRANR